MTALTARSAAFEGEVRMTVVLSVTSLNYRYFVVAA